MKRNFILFCILFTIATNFFTAAKAQVNTTDSLALVDFYNSTNGPNWYDHTNWLTTEPVSTWYGVTVTNNRVFNLYLSSHNLSGTIPKSFGNLTNLSHLDLSKNHLRGTIPATIGNLDSITTVSFYSNKLSGTIPFSIGKLIHLTNLDLSANQLTGVIPSSIGKLVNLTELFLFTNQLSGTIPANLSNLKNVQDLYLTNNQLTGTIPSFLGNLSNILSLNLANNHLSGAIPFSLNKLQSAFIGLDDNQLIKFADGYPSNDTDNITISIYNNLFTFNGLQVIAKYYPNVDYFRQDTILPIHQNGNTLSVSAGGTLSNNTYSWYQVGNSTSTVIQKDSTFTPAASGRYYVMVKNKVAKQLTLYSDTVKYVMAAAQKSSNTFIVKMAQSATNSKHTLVYPNPATNIIHVQTNSSAIITFTNSAGKLLLSKTITNSGEINVSSYANGVYSIQNKSTGETQKVVVVH